ncbi:MAG TPA: DUF4386 domain-containing protein [Thermoleophilia bacterium]|nr:DUF4386 domain-containing protein [Thermoleophilia bacterium]
MTSPDRSPYRTTAIVVGVLYIIATAASLLSTALTSGALDAPDYLTAIAAHGDRVVTGALLLIAGGLSVVLIAALLFPVLKRYGEGIALAYVGVRILEAVALVVSVVSLLLLVSVARDSVRGGAGAPAAAHLSSLGSLLQALNDWSFPLNPVVFGLGGLLLYFLLYRSRLVPRWLSIWGLAGVAMVFAFGLLRMYGSGTLALALPIGVQEMVLAGWLIVRGFDFSADGIEPVRTDAGRDSALAVRVPSGAVGRG